MHRNCEDSLRHTTTGCFYSGLISFPHRFVKTGKTRLVWGKSLHTTRKSVISLLATFDVSRTYELCHVNVILLAEFSYPTTVCHCDGSCDHEDQPCIVCACTLILGYTCQLWQHIKTRNSTYSCAWMTDAVQAIRVIPLASAFTADWLVFPTVL